MKISMNIDEKEKGMNNDGGDDGVQISKRARKKADGWIDG
jgi:hypothetical protein